MRRLVLGVACVALAGCGQRHALSEQKLNTFDVATPKAPGSETSGPQIAYAYSLSYMLDADSIGAVQARQTALCRTLGPARCLVMKTDLNRDDANGSTSAQTALLVDARLATQVEQRLDALATDAGGSVAARHVSAEDVTKQVIDTDARVRAKQALADRLFRLIGSANGKVGDLVQAEKAFADTQGELEAARGELAELRRRVAMSEINLDYLSTASTGSLAPVRQAAHGAGATLAASLAALVTFLIAALPWALLVTALVWLRRRFGWRWPLRPR